MSAPIAAGLGGVRRLVTPGRLALAAVVAFLWAWPYLGASRFLLHLGSLFFIWAVVASYWNLLNGYAGIISLGNMGFFAVGAYTSAVAAKELAISPWITIWIGAIVSMVLVTVFLGLPVLRLRGIYIALLTLVFADALPSVISILHDWTGGGVGLLGIPEFLTDLQKWQGYYLTLGFAIVALGALHRIVHGKTGMAFVALRDSEAFAVALGVDRFREGVKVFAISAFVTGMAGGFFAHTLGQISPGMLGIEQFLMVVAMWLLGGAGTFFGPIVGAAIITFGNEYLRVAGSVRLGLLGGLIMVTVLFFPGGIMQIVGRLGALLRRGDRGREGTPEEASRGLVPVPAGEDLRAAAVDRGASLPDRED
ncbi:MAG TPA: branched-chain amino acid ABC transporter permease [Actinomycetota bacterium]